MKKKGFTYLEVMIAMSVFLVLSLLVMRLNIAANKNMNMQVERQNMMMEAQKLLEKYKTTTTDIGTYVDENYSHNSFQLIDGYYVVVQGKSIDNQGPPTLLEVMVRVRKNTTDKNSEVVLIGHFLKN